MNNTKTIAVFGKGGVGKTSLSSLMVKTLADKHNKRILAIDADPAVGLASALGVEVVKTVDDIRKDIIESVKKGDNEDKEATMRLLDYEIFDALAQGDNFAFLAIGRPEDEGCYCRVNYLLKDIIHDLADNFDIVLIDGEAGIEQINRRVMKTVDNLILISDTSAKGINVINTIWHVAHDNKAVNYEKAGMVINRVRDKSEVDAIAGRSDIDLLGWVPEDEYLRKFDFEGRPLTELPDDSSPKKVVDEILAKLGF